MHLKFYNEAKSLYLEISGKELGAGLLQIQRWNEWHMSHSTRQHHPEVNCICMEEPI